MNCTLFTMSINLVTRNCNLRTIVNCLLLILYALFSYNFIDIFRVCHNIESNLLTPIYIFLGKKSMKIQNTVSV